MGFRLVTVRPAGATDISKGRPQYTSQPQGSGVSGGELEGLEGLLEVHHLLPEEKQGAMVRLEGILDELLRVHDYPEDVLEVVGSRMGEWCRRWHDRGVRRGSTLSEFEFSRVPRGVVARDGGGEAVDGAPS